ncbi:MAG: 23S rRNA pseudouridylate synthase B, partial [Arenicellales bacterium]
MARLGLGSRREIESWIAQARVVVDDQPAVLGQQITERSKVLLDGKPVRLSRVFAGSARVILYHKPVGEICSRDDPQGRPSVFDRLPRLRGQRWV